MSEFLLSASGQGWACRPPPAGAAARRRPPDAPPDPSLEGPSRLGRGPRSQDACCQRLVPMCVTASFLMARRVLLEARVRGGGRRGLAPGSEVLVVREARPSSASAGRKELHKSLICPSPCTPPPPTPFSGLSGSPLSPPRSSEPPDEPVAGQPSAQPPRPSGSEETGSPWCLPHTFCACMVSGLPINETSLKTKLYEALSLRGEICVQSECMNPMGFLKGRF